MNRLPLTPLYMCICIRECIYFMGAGTLFSKRNATFLKLRFFWRRVYTSESGVMHHFDPHPGPQEKSTEKSCVSFGKDCKSRRLSRLQGGQKKVPRRPLSTRLYYFFYIDTISPTPYKTASLWIMMLYQSNTMKSITNFIITFSSWSESVNISTFSHCFTLISCPGLIYFEVINVGHVNFMNIYLTWTDIIMVWLMVALFISLKPLTVKVRLLFVVLLKQLKLKLSGKWGSYPKKKETLIHEIKICEAFIPCNCCDEIWKAYQSLPFNHRWEKMFSCEKKFLRWIAIRGDIKSSGKSTIFSWLKIEGGRGYKLIPEKFKLNMSNFPFHTGVCIPAGIFEPVVDLRTNFQYQ